MRLLFYLALLALKIGIFIFLVIRPWRRAERARVLLDLLTIGLKQGWSPEATLVAASTSRDRTLPVRVHLLAAHIEDGDRLDAALDRVPDLVPTAIRRQIQLGVRTGTLPAMLKVARASAGREGIEETAVFLPGILIQLIVPWASISLVLLLVGLVGGKFIAIRDDLLPGDSWRLKADFGFAGLTLTETASLAMATLAACIAGLYLWMFSPAVGPRLTRWIPVLDRLWLIIPWRRQRLHRDFAGSLAVLLDAGVPEDLALTEAGVATGNRVLARRAARAADQLRTGKGLAEASEGVFPAGELRWRLDAGRHGRDGFAASFSGWLRALGESAGRRETVAAQGLATTITFLNGLLVATVAIGMFRLFVLLMDYNAE